MLAGPGRVRLGVDVQAHGDARLAVGRAGLVLAPVGHQDGDLVIVGVDVFLHGSGPLKRRAVYLRPRFGASLGLPGKSPDFRGFSAALGLWLQKAQYAALCRSEEHTSELQSLMRISYAVFCLKKTKMTSNSIIANNKTI